MFFFVGGVGGVGKFEQFLFWADEMLIETNYTKSWVLPLAKNGVIIGSEWITLQNLPEKNGATKKFHEILVVS